MRFRMKDSYETSTILAMKVRAYLDLTRPFTLLAPFIGGVLFGLMALLYSDDKSLDWDTGFKIFYGAITLVLLNAGSNAINQVTDVDTDKINKPYRPIPAGAVTEGEAETIGYLLWFIGLTRAMLTGWVFFAVCLGIWGATYIYSKPPAMKRRFVLNNLTIAVSRGFLGPLAGWSVIGDPFAPPILAICTVFAIYTFGATVFKDLPDKEGDKQNDVRNFVTVMGERSAVAVAGCFMVGANLVATSFTIMGILPPATMWFNLNLVLTAWILFMAWGGDESDSYIENRWSWVLMYIQMMLMMIFFFAIFWR